ncbi:MAG: glycosyltransferase family 2 protein [Xanthomonadales bacterium]|nr:glycosyltransferase family 2 protein [Xanthomonadales bacterium]
MSIDTIIVNYNAGEALQRCVNAVRTGTRHSRIIVIDNASDDGSAERLRNLYGDRSGIEFLFNQANLGFAPAINAVARRSTADWILVLNPDCIVEADTLERLQSALIPDPRSALAGPAVRDKNGRMQRATVRRFPTPWKSLMTASGLWRLGRWFPFMAGVEVDTSKLGQEAISCDAVSGACMLVRREALEDVGFLDENYTLHCEDLDLMYRLKLEGWQCLYVPGAGCIHYQGLSSRKRPSWVHFHKHLGMVRFFRKFQASSTFLPFRWLVYVGIWLRFLVLWPLVLIRR